MLLAGISTESRRTRPALSASLSRSVMSRTPHSGLPVFRLASNAALLGAFAALTRFVRLDSVERAIEEAFPGKIGAANIAAARAAHEFVSMQQLADSAA